MNEPILQLQNLIKEQKKKEEWVPCVLSTSMGAFHGFIVLDLDEKFVYGRDQLQRVDYALDLNRDDRTIWRIPLARVREIYIPRYDLD